MLNAVKHLSRESPRDSSLHQAFAQNDNRSKFSPCVAGHAQRMPPRRKTVVMLNEVRHLSASALPPNLPQIWGDKGGLLNLISPRSSGGQKGGQTAKDATIKSAYHPTQTVVMLNEVKHLSASALPPKSAADLGGQRGASESDFPPVLRGDKRGVKPQRT
jgi:hypothetical protein